MTKVMKLHELKKKSTKTLYNIALYFEGFRAGLLF